MLANGLSELTSHANKQLMAAVIAVLTGVVSLSLYA
jgi:hypothetical protein